MSHKQTKDDKKAFEFLTMKKKEMKENKYRKRFDNLLTEIENNLVNTTVSYGEKMYENSGWGSVMTYSKTATGNTDMNVYPQKLTGRDQSRSGVPTSIEPIAFSKIITAASVLGGKLPDATVMSDSKVFSKASYELWKKTWVNRMGNGQNTLSNVYQNMFTYGWATWRVYPRRVQVKRKGVDKIIFDDIYREAMNPRRTWLGVGSSNYDYFSQLEVYYEKDIQIDLFKEMYPDAVNKDGELDYCASLSDEAREEDQDKAKTHVTIGYYENVLMNKFIVACGELIIVDDELPNDDSFGSIVTTRCFIRDSEDPYGVGLYEMMRGNTATYSYINSLNAQQVEAEVFPLLFGTQVQNGTSTYKRGPNIVNPKTPGTSIDVVKTSGNIQAGVLFADKQKTNIEENTGVNNIIAGQGSEDTLGSTVIMKEAAQNRLVLPRNNMVDALELDALISHSWIMQTYSVDKVFRLSTDDQLKEFAIQNKDHFIESEQIIDEDGSFLGYMVAASPNIRVDFDFDQDGNILEDVDTRKISSREFLNQMDNYGHKSNFIQFIIDPNSMLLPSQAIQQQQYLELYPIIQNTLSSIFAIRMQDPQAAAAQLKTFDTLLTEYKKSIFDYISKKTYDEIISEQLPVGQMEMMQINNAMNPENEGGAPGQEMTPDGTDPMQPQSPEEMPTPQGPIGSSVDGSVGYAASMPMTPNK